LDTLQLSPATVGLIIGVGGVGAFLCAAIAQPLGRALGPMRTVILSLALAQIAYLCIVASLYAPSASIPLLVTQQLIGDAFFGAYFIHAVSLRQRHMPEAVLGRVNATFHAMSGLMLPLGALLAGPLASRFGMSTTLWINSIGGLFAAPVLLLALRAKRSGVPE
jgi:predicted MFS family arabinose efflux permease